MKITGYKLALKPNKEQRVLCAKGAGTARFAYNWKLGQLIDQYQKAKVEQGVDKPKVKMGSAMDWNKEIVQLKKTEGFGWLNDVSKCAPQEALRALEGAFKRFFRTKKGFPKFKKKSGNDSFTVTGSVWLTPTHIQIPKVGKIRLKQKNYPCLEGKILLSQATISRVADSWFVSFIIQEDIDLPQPASLNDIESSHIIGVDLGIKSLAVASNGVVFENPKTYSKYQIRLKRYQRRMSRKKKGSNNKKKAKLKVSRIHKKIADIRNNTVHQLTASLVKTKPKMIVVESLKPQQMVKNHRLAASIVDAAFSRINECLTYKCEWNGIRLVKAHPYYASSQYCSHCGSQNHELKLSDRSWTCKHCESFHDRDVNASLNLQYYGLWLIDKHENTVGSTGNQACGDARTVFLTEHCASLKQEFKSSKNIEMCI